MAHFGAFLVGGGQAGQLDQNAVVALGLDERLGHAEFIHALAQHFDRMGEGGAGIGGLGQPVGVHLHEEGGAALQVEAQPDAAGGLALQAVENESRRVQLVPSLRRTGNSG